MQACLEEEAVSNSDGGGGKGVWRFAGDQGLVGLWTLRVDILQASLICNYSKHHGKWMGRLNHSA